MEQSASLFRLVLVRCPNCKHILPESPGFSLYRCGVCGTFLKARWDSYINSLFLTKLQKNVDSEPVRKYHQKAQDIMVLLSQILSRISNTEIASHETLQRALTTLRCAVDQLRKLFYSWELLSCRVYFVQQAEALISKVRNCSVEVVEMLVASDQHLPTGSSLIWLQDCAHKLKSLDCEVFSTCIARAIRDRMEGSEAVSDSLNDNIVDCLCLHSNQEFIIELVALEERKLDAERAGESEEVKHIEHIISVITDMHNNFVEKKISDKYMLPIPVDFLCPLSLELMRDPVIIASGHTYERKLIKKLFDLGLSVCPKTREPLSHKFFIPDYTTKALITSWLESNNVRLLNPMDSSEEYISRTSFDGLNSDVESMSHLSYLSILQSSDVVSTCRSRATYASPAPSHYSISSSKESYPGTALDGLMSDLERISVSSSKDGSGITIDRSGMNRLRYYPMMLFTKSLSTFRRFLRSPDSNPSSGSARSSISYSAILRDLYSPSHSHSSPEASFHEIASDRLAVDFGRMSIRSSEGVSMDSVRHSPLLLSDNVLSSDDNGLLLGHNSIYSASIIAGSR